MVEGVGHLLDVGLLAEQVAGDDEQFDGVLVAEFGDALDAPLQVVGAVQPAELVTQVPVGRVQDSHGVGSPGGRVGECCGVRPECDRRRQKPLLTAVLKPALRPVAPPPVGSASAASFSLRANGGKGIFASIGSRKLGW